MKNNEQKIIRGIELNCRKKKDEELNNELDYIDENQYLTERYVSDSELLRIIEAIDKENIEVRDLKSKKVKYLSGIIFVKVNHNFPKYNKIKDNDGILVLNHKHFECKVDENGKEKYELVATYEDEQKKVPRKEYFKRLMVGAGHNRSKKQFLLEKIYSIRFIKSYLVVLTSMKRRTVIKIIIKVMQSGIVIMHCRLQIPKQ